MWKFVGSFGRTLAAVRTSGRTGTSRPSTITVHFGIFLFHSKSLAVATICSRVRAFTGLLAMLLTSNTSYYTPDTNNNYYIAHSGHEQESRDHAVELAEGAGVSEAGVGADRGVDQAAGGRARRADRGLYRGDLGERLLGCRGRRGVLSVVGRGRDLVACGLLARRRPVEDLSVIGPRPGAGRAAGRPALGALGVGRAARVAAADRRRGARGGGEVPRVLRRADRQPADAGGVRAGRGAVFGLVRGPGLGARGGLAAAGGGLHPDAPRVGAHGQAAPGRHPHARRLARRQPGPPGEPGGGRAGAPSTLSRRARRWCSRRPRPAGSSRRSTPPRARAGATGRWSR